MKAETTRFFVDSVGDYLVIRGERGRWVTPNSVYNGVNSFPYTKCDINLLTERYRLRELEIHEVVLIPKLDKERVLE